MTRSRLTATRERTRKQAIGLVTTVLCDFMHVSCKSFYSFDLLCLFISYYFRLTFLSVTCSDIGTVTSVRLRIDGNDGWNVGDIEVQDFVNDDVIDFNCNCWIDDGADAAGPSTVVVERSDTGEKALTSNTDCCKTTCFFRTDT